MGFSFDFAGERSVIVYQAEAGMVLDENIYSMLRREELEGYILPFELENTGEIYRFYYDITGCTNMMAWMGERGFMEKRKMKKKIESTQKLLIRCGVPKEMIEQEMKYMFVDDEDEEVRFLCIPLRENKHMHVSAKEKRVFTDTDLPPLPDTIPVPSENEAGFQNYTAPTVQKKPEMDIRDTGNGSEGNREENKWNETDRNENNRKENNWSEDSWNTEKWNEEEEVYVLQEKQVVQNIEPLGEQKRFSKKDSFISGDRELQREEPVHHIEETMDNDTDEEDGTVLLYDPDDEGTVLLKVPPKINARLIRRSTGEEFVINKERTKIGKKAAVVDICIQGNKTISREHCVITFEEGVFFLEDCRSLNHTYLNKTELEPEVPVRLETGSEIQMSDELFDFVIEEGER